MKHDYRERAIAFEKKTEMLRKAFIDDCLSRISNIISEVGGVIHEGNYNLYVKDGVVRIYMSFDKFDETNPKHVSGSFELYSEDGWLGSEDIANWLDIAIRYKEKHSVKGENEYLTADEIYNTFVELSHSQGFYGRLIHDMGDDKTWLKELEEQHFPDTLSLILYVEG